MKCLISDDFGDFDHSSYTPIAHIQALELEVKVGTGTGTGTFMAIARSIHIQHTITITITITITTKHIFPYNIAASNRHHANTIQVPIVRH